jgi:hypothetical protein
VCRRCGGSLRPGVARRSISIANELTPFLYQLPTVVGIRLHFVHIDVSPLKHPYNVQCDWCLLPTSNIARMHISKSFINGVREFKTTPFCDEHYDHVYTQGNSIVTGFLCSACRAELNDHVDRAPLSFVHDDSVIVEQLPYLLQDLTRLVLSYYRSVTE